MQNTKEIDLAKAGDVIAGEQVLDKGFVLLVDFMGGDEAVVRSARVSYGKILSEPERDRKLIHYLMKHGHHSPFEHSVFQLHIKCPIFVARQWFRHRVGSFEGDSFYEGCGLFDSAGSSINEISGRYTELQDEFYVPDFWRFQSKSNKQASVISSVKEGWAETEEARRSLLESFYRSTFQFYKTLLEVGLARELARMILPLSSYTSFYWTINARALMHFITLRADAGAQWEIQQYAEALMQILKEKMPVTWEAFTATPDNKGG